MTEQVLTPEQEDAAQEAAFQEQAAKSDKRLSGDVVEDDDTPPPKPDAEPTGAPAAPEVDVDAVLAKLPSDVRDAVKGRLDALNGELDKERNNARSAIGRISAYQRRYEEAAGLKQPAAAKAATDEQKATWNQFQTDYPDIAKSIEAKFAEVQPAADIGNIVEWIEGEKRSRFLNDSYEAVESVHPQWRGVVRTKEFLDWKATSPTYEKLADSDELSDAVTLLDLYKAYGPKSAAPDPQAVAAATQLAARRGAQADGGKAAPSRASTPNEGLDMSDPDQLFAAYAAASNKRLRNRYK